MSQQLAAAPSQTVVPGPPPETIYAVELTKHGRPPQHSQKQRLVVVRSDAIFFLKPALGGAAAAAEAAATRLQSASLDRRSSSSDPAAHPEGKNGLGRDFNEREVDTLKRAIPIGKLRAIEQRQRGRWMRLAIQGEHDVVLSTEDDRLMVAFTSALDRATCVANVVVRFSRKKNASFDLAALNLTKNNADGGSGSAFSNAGDTLQQSPSGGLNSPSNGELLSPRTAALLTAPGPASQKRYLALHEKMRVRAACKQKCDVVPEARPHTLAQWDATMPVLPPAVPPQSMPVFIRQALAGAHVSMLGAVDVHRADLPHSEPRLLAFTPHRIYCFNRETGEMTFHCSLFSILSLEHEHSKLTLKLEDEQLPEITFSFPPDVLSPTSSPPRTSSSPPKGATSQGLDRSSSTTVTDMSQVGSAIAFLIKRHGYPAKCLAKNRPSTMSPPSAMKKPPVAVPSLSAESPKKGGMAKRTGPPIGGAANSKSPPGTPRSNSLPPVAIAAGAAAAGAAAGAGAAAAENAPQSPRRVSMVTDRGELLHPGDDDDDEGGHGVLETRTAAAAPPPISAAEKRRQQAAAYESNGLPPSLANDDEASGAVPGDPSIPLRARTNTVALLMTPGLDEGRLRAQVPDYRDPQGRVCRKFLSPGTLLARRVHRLTSKLSWESRVLVIVSAGIIMICTEDRQVRRSIAVDKITDITVLRHREGQTLTMVVDGEHDCILRARMETSVSLNMAQAASIIKYLNRDTDIRNEYMEESREDLKKLVSRGRSLRKPGDFYSPAEEMKEAKRRSAQNSPAGTPRQSMTQPPPGRVPSMLNSPRDAMDRSANGTPRELHGGDRSSSPYPRSPHGITDRDRTQSELRGVSFSDVVPEAMPVTPGDTSRELRGGAAVHPQAGVQDGAHDRDDHNRRMTRATSGAGPMLISEDDDDDDRHHAPHRPAKEAAPTPTPMPANSAQQEQDVQTAQRQRDIDRQRGAEAYRSNAPQQPQSNGNAGSAAGDDGSSSAVGAAAAAAVAVAATAGTAAAVGSHRSGKKDGNTDDTEGASTHERSAAPAAAATVAVAGAATASTAATANAGADDDQHVRARGDTDFSSATPDSPYGRTRSGDDAGVAVDGGVDGSTNHLAAPEEQKVEEDADTKAYRKLQEREKARRSVDFVEPSVTSAAPSHSAVGATATHHQDAPSGPPVIIGQAETVQDGAQVQPQVQPQQTEATPQALQPHTAPEAELQAQQADAAPHQTAHMEEHRPDPIALSRRREQGGPGSLYRTVSEDESASTNRGRAHHDGHDAGVAAIVGVGAVGVGVGAAVVHASGPASSPLPPVAPTRTKPTSRAQMEDVRSPATMETLSVAFVVDEPKQQQNLMTSERSIAPRRSEIASRSQAEEARKVQDDDDEEMEIDTAQTAAAAPPTNAPSVSAPAPSASEPTPNSALAPVSAAAATVGVGAAGLAIVGQNDNLGQNERQDSAPSNDRSATANQTAPSNPNVDSAVAAAALPSQQSSQQYLTVEDEHQDRSVSEDGEQPEPERPMPVVFHQDDDAQVRTQEPQAHAQPQVQEHDQQQRSARPTATGPSAAFAQPPVESHPEPQQESQSEVQAPAHVQSQAPQPPSIIGASTSAHGLRSDDQPRSQSEAQPPAVMPSIIGSDQPRGVVSDAFTADETQREALPTPTPSSSALGPVDSSSQAPTAPANAPLPVAGSSTSTSTSMAGPSTTNSTNAVSAAVGAAGTAATAVGVVPIAATGAVVAAGAGATVAVVGASAWAADTNSEGAATAPRSVENVATRDATADSAPASGVSQMRRDSRPLPYQAPPVEEPVSSVRTEAQPQESAPVQSYTAAASAPPPSSGADGQTAAVTPGRATVAAQGPLIIPAPAPGPGPVQHQEQQASRNVVVPTEHPSGLVGTPREVQPSSAAVPNSSSFAPDGQSPVPVPPPQQQHRHHDPHQQQFDGQQMQQQQQQQQHQQQGQYQPYGLYPQRHQSQSQQPVKAMAPSASANGAGDAGGVLSPTPGVARGLSPVMSPRHWTPNPTANSGAGDLNRRASTPLNQMQMQPFSQSQSQARGASVSLAPSRSLYLAAMDPKTGRVDPSSAVESTVGPGGEPWLSVRVKFRHHVMTMYCEAGMLEAFAAAEEAADDITDREETYGVPPPNALTFDNDRTQDFVNTAAASSRASSAMPGQSPNAPLGSLSRSGLGSFAGVGNGSGLASAGSFADQTPLSEDAARAAFVAINQTYDVGTVRGMPNPAALEAVHPGGSLPEVLRETAACVCAAGPCVLSFPVSAFLAMLERSSDGGSSAPLALRGDSVLVRSPSSFEWVSVHRQELAVRLWSGGYPSELALEAEARAAA